MVSVPIITCGDFFHYELTLIALVDCSFKEVNAMLKEACRAS